MDQRLLTLWTGNVWVHLGITLLLALLLTLLLDVALQAAVRRLGPRHALAVDVAARASMPLRWLLPLLILTVTSRAFTVDSRSFTLLRHGLLIATLAVATWLAVRCISVFENVAVRRYPMDTADNLRARRVITQVRVLGRIADVLVIFLGLAVMLLTIPGVRQVGASLLASAGVAGLVLGLAAKPVLSNLLAGVQIALTQPIRLDDVVIIEGEWGRVEEITGSYVVVRIWDQRRLIVPLSWIIENPFQNWTRSSSQLIGTVFLWLDYRVPLAALREELKRLCAEAAEWDGRVCLLQVTDSSDRAMQLRALVSATDSGRSWDLRCRVREGLIAYVQAHHPEALPRWRGELEQREHQPAPAAPMHASPEPQQSPSPEDGGPLRGDPVDPPVQGETT
jgi:small-conductance mechanosensitive channel